MIDAIGGVESPLWVDLQMRDAGVNPVAVCKRLIGVIRAVQGEINVVTGIGRTDITDGKAGVCRDVGDWYRGGWSG